MLTIDLRLLFTCTELRFIGLCCFKILTSCSSVIHKITHSCVLHLSSLSVNKIFIVLILSNLQADEAR